MNNKIFVNLFRILIILVFIFLWEYLSYKNIINSFIFSSPSKIIKCISTLYNSNNLFNHIFITITETVVAFSLSITIALFIGILFYECNFVYRVFEPFLTLFNSMPKVALGPLIIIVFGAKETSIIIMALSITLILNIMQIYNSFSQTDKYLDKLLTIYHASRYEKLKYLVIPSALVTIVNSLKINISMTLIGVIMGEFLVSKAGIGYLIVYGSQVFNLTLVLTGIFILILISFVMYVIITIIENKIKRSYN